MSDWRSQQIGNGVSRCPADYDDIHQPLTADEILEIQARWQDPHTGYPVVLPTPIRSSPMIGEHAHDPAIGAESLIAEIHRQPWWRKWRP